MPFMKGTKHEIEQGSQLNRPLLAAMFTRVMQALEGRKLLLKESQALPKQIEEVTKAEKVIGAFFNLLSKETDPTGLKPEAGEVLKGRLLIRGNPHHETIRMRCPRNYQVLVDLYEGVRGWLRVRLVQVFRPDGSQVCRATF